MASQSLTASSDHAPAWSPWHSALAWWPTADRLQGLWGLSVRLASTDTRSTVCSAGCAAPAGPPAGDLRRRGPAGAGRRRAGSQPGSRHCCVQEPGSLLVRPGGRWDPSMAASAAELCMLPHPSGGRCPPSTWLHRGPKHWPQHKTQCFSMASCHLMLGQHLSGCFNLLQMAGTNFAKP